jgi:hypothetical protein
VICSCRLTVGAGFKPRLGGGLGRYKRPYSHSIMPGGLLVTS